MAAYHLTCTECGRRFGRDARDYLCPDCAAHWTPGTSLHGVLRVTYEHPQAFPHVGPWRVPRARASAADGRDQRRYLALLPIDDADLLPPLPVGPTPLLAPPRLRRELSLPHLYLKDETVLPTGSLKDRASSLVVAKAREKGHAVVVTASTGNAATALAAMCAAAGLGAVILVPADAPRAKLAQMLIHGARVLPVEGSYDDAFRLCVAAAERLGWYNRSTAYNPYTIEGKKTVAFEIWEQLAGRAPDAVVVPTGDGAILAAVAKGFEDLVAARLAERVPRLIAVQAAGSDAIVSAWESAQQNPGHLEVRPLHVARTCADSLRVAAPANGRWAVRALLSTQGCGVRVADEQMLAAVCQLAVSAGLFAEPAGAAALAGVESAVRAGVLDREERVVLLITGSGLKDVDAALATVTIPRPLPATWESIQQAVADSRLGPA